MKYILSLGGLIALVTMQSTILSCAQSSEQVHVPYFFDASTRLTMPDIRSIKRLRFLTTVDFPPFNSIDYTGRLSGYNIDLLKAICAELNLENICQVEARPWDQLVDLLMNSQGDAIIAGLNNNQKLNKKLSFTPAYLKFPARFMALQSMTLNQINVDDLSNLTTGLLRNTVHEKLFKNYFPNARFVLFDDDNTLYQAVKKKDIQLAFCDGLAFSLYLNDTQSNDCCHFVGGPYIAPQYLNAGMRIAVARDNPQLLAALEYALQSLERKGKLNELYLRYFPIGFY